MPLPENVITICTELIDAHAGVLSKEIYTPERIEEIEQALLEQLRNPVDLPPDPKTLARNAMQDVIERNRVACEAAKELIEEKVMSIDELTVAFPDVAAVLASSEPE